MPAPARHDAHRSRSNVGGSRRARNQTGVPPNGDQRKARGDGLYGRHRTRRSGGLWPDGRRHRGGVRPQRPRGQGRRDHRRGAGDRSHPAPQLPLQGRRTRQDHARRSATRHSARLSFTTDLGEFADRDLVIEAVVENEQVKTEIFQVLDQVVTRPDAILASNTSSIPLVKLAVATSPPGPGHRHPLLQPGPGAEARRADPRADHVRRDGHARRGPGAGRAGQARRSAPRTAPASSSTRC